jgi:2-polyprenyl-3-methyl-5-hydroxy-6-metoxy-1,4-benzoquinol methylase
VAQNIYDDPAFFAGYSEFPRSREGLSGTSEWPAMRALLPAIAGKRVLDLGCGFGQFSRWLAGEGAASVLGIDLSEKMLERARAETGSAAISYKRGDLEHIELEPLAYDLVVSSMALHYVANFHCVVRTVHTALIPGCDFVFSVEHPIYAARAEPEWTTTADGRRSFSITDYGIEGKRVTNWVTDGVVKYHRSIATMLNTLADTGFVYRAMDEWTPSGDQLVAHPEWRETEFVRPVFLLISVQKPERGGH